MSISLAPYLNFDGRCAEAMAFYAKALGGELTTMPFSSGPDKVGPELANRIMHASIKTPTLVLMASDTMPGMPAPSGSAVQLSLHTDTVEEQDRLWAALSAGGKVTMPLADQFWGARFGMFTDKFGIQWMMNCENKR